MAGRHSYLKMAGGLNYPQEVRVAVVSPLVTGNTCYLTVCPCGGFWPETVRKFCQNSDSGSAAWRRAHQILFGFYSASSEQRPCDDMSDVSLAPEEGGAPHCLLTSSGLLPGSHHAPETENPPLILANPLTWSTWPSQCGQSELERTP